MIFITFSKHFHLFHNYTNFTFITKEKLNEIHFVSPFLYSKRLSRSPRPLLIATGLPAR